MLISQGIATILRLYYILGRIATLAREQQYHKRKMNTSTDVKVNRP